MTYINPSEYVDAHKGCIKRTILINKASDITIIDEILNVHYYMFVLFFIQTRIIRKFTEIDSGVRIPAYSFLPGGSFRLKLTSISPSDCKNITISVGRLSEFSEVDDLYSKKIGEVRIELQKDIEQTFLVNSISGYAKIGGFIREKGRYDVFILPPCHNFSFMANFSAKNPNSKLDYWSRPILDYMPYCIGTCVTIFLVWCVFIYKMKPLASSVAYLFSCCLGFLLCYNVSYYISMKKFDISDEPSTARIISILFKSYQFFLYALFLPLSHTLEKISEKRRKCFFIVHIIICYIAFSGSIAAELANLNGYESIISIISAAIILLLWFVYATKSDCYMNICILFTAFGMYATAELLYTVAGYIGIRHWVLKLVQDVVLLIVIIMVVVVYAKDIKEDKIKKEENYDLEERLNSTPSDY